MRVNYFFAISKNDRIIKFTDVKFVLLFVVSFNYLFSLKLFSAQGPRSK